MDNIPIARSIRINAAGDYQVIGPAGVPHSFDGEPAIITSCGVRIWYENGAKHNLKGPAVVYPSELPPKWFINGRKVTFAYWLEYADLTEEEKVLLKLKYG